ncbi:MAG: S41 family peptidase [Muribaculaceae bacterium]|nr:S41 family peptidase [Muribaculaceae bacterium]
MKSAKTLYFIPALFLVGVLTIAAKAPKSHDAAVSRNLQIFNALVKELEMNYVDSISTDESFEMAIDAMLLTVDPYTEYYNSEDRKQLETMTTGEYGGIGSYIMERDNNTYISEPYEGSPAAQGGLRGGDHIVRVDTTNTRGMKSSEVTKLLRGVPGTKVTVEVVRPYAEDSVVVVELERKKLQMPSVIYSKMLDNGLGYINLESFIDKSPEEVKAALDRFKADPKLKGVILDLRGNGGGLLESAVDIVGFFVPKGTEVLRTRGKEKNSEKIYRTRNKPILPDIPLAVLIDGGSASASEITAGAIQDLDRGVLIGTRSFGKGLVQSTRPLPSDGLLKVTVAKYYIPSGRLIQALDYSHRNEDGSVARTPDSLTNVYHTRAGREVRDGGGLKPDFEVEWVKNNQLVYSLLQGNWIFDYGTKYASKHPTIAPASEFEITDEIYEDFKMSIDPKKLKYDKVYDDIMQRMSDFVKSEGYLTDEVQMQMDTLKNMLQPDLDKDLDRSRKRISTYLRSEILSRYYFQKGKVESSLKDDPGLDKAVEILLNPSEYRKTLRGEASKEDKREKKTGSKK